MRCQMVSGSSPSSSTLMFTLRTKKHASTGTTVSATTSEASSANVTVSAEGQEELADDAAHEADAAGTPRPW